MVYQPRAVRLAKADTTKKKTAGYNISDIDELKAFAESKGLKVEEKKPGLFTRALDILSRPVYASAGAAKAITQRVKTGEWKENPLEEAWKGLKGEEKETYSDVLKEAGVQNKWIRGGVGFALDVALDPSTYVGGSLVKGAGKVLKGATKVGTTVGRKVAPTSTALLELTGKNLKDAVGKAFDIHYGLSKIKGNTVADDIGRYFNKLGMAKEDIVNKTAQTLNKFDDKTLKEATNIMLQNKRLELAARKGSVVDYIKGKGNVADAVEEMKNIGLNIGKQTGIPEEQLYKNYFPSILNLRERAFQELPSSIKVGKEGYLKEFKGLLPDESLLKKPIEAYSRREYEVFRNNLTRKTLNDVVESYGKPLSAFDNADEALKQGYRAVKEKTFGKEIGYLKDNDFRYINNYMFPEMKTIDMLAKATGYDGLTRMFKTAVTAYFPAFHIRNFLSGTVQNYSVLGRQAFNPANFKNGLGIMKGTDNIIKFPKWSGTGAELKKELLENFGGASRYISDLGDYVEEIGSKGFKLKKGIEKLNPRQVGNFIESWQKSTAMSAALKQGATLPEAIKLAEKAGFDYSKITKFESKIMRRLIPFYTFARKNAALQASTLAKNPERILNQIKFTKNLSEIFGGEKPTEEDIKGLPDWALSGLGFKVEGNRYLTQFGLPLEEFVGRIARPGKTTLSSLNPIVKYPLESKLGYDFFREQDLVDINKISPATGQLVKEKAPDWLKDIMRVKRVDTDYGVKYYASPKALHLLRNIPTARFQNTLEKMFDGDMNKVDKWLAFLTGAKIYDIDVELQKYFKERDLKRDIEDQLLQRGEIGKGEYTFIRKDQ